MNVPSAPANDTVWWNNPDIAYLGWQPKDNSAAFRDKVTANDPAPAPDDPAALYQGGQFAADPIIED